MRSSSMQFVRAFMLSALIAGLSACDKNPSEPKNENPDSPKAQAGASGVAVYQAANTVNQMQSLIGFSEGSDQLEVPAVGSLAKANQLMQGKLSPVREHIARLRQRGELGKVAGDSIIFERTYTDLFGIKHHEWVVYNDATGKAAVYLVATHPTGFLGVLRDSTLINLNTNFTIPDSSDDVIERLHNHKDFKAGHFLRLEEGTLTPDPYSPGAEPTGGILEGRRVFAAGQDSSEVTTRLEIHQALGIAWEKRVRLGSGRTYEENVTISPNGTGTYLTKFPGGRIEAGTFDVNGDDHNVSFTKTTTFPGNANPRSIYESAEFTINPADSSWTGNFVREVRFANGQVTSTETEIVRTVVNGFDRVTITQDNSNGTGGTVTLQEKSTGYTIEGSWVDEEGHYILVDGTFLHDGSGDLHLKVYASRQAYETGAAPIFEATLHFNPDGSGNGNITSGPETGSFSFDANGEVGG